MLYDVGATWQARLTSAIFGVSSFHAAEHVLSSIT